MKPQTGCHSWCCFTTQSAYSAVNNSGAWGCTGAKQSRSMGKKTDFLLLIVTLFGQFIRIKAAVIPFFILFQIHCNAFFGILLASAPAIFLAHEALNVTLAMKPLQKVPFKLTLGWVFAGFFDICQALIVLS